MTIVEGVSWLGSARYWPSYNYTSHGIMHSPSAGLGKKYRKERELLEIALEFLASWSIGLKFCLYAGLTVVDVIVNLP